MNRNRPNAAGVAFALLGLLVVSLAGCPEKSKEAQTPHPAAPTTSLTLHVRVLNDPELVKAIDLLRGEWTEQSGGSFTVKEIDAPELFENRDADIIIFPPLLLGELCEQQQLRPIRDSVLRDEEFRYTDIYPAVREDLLRYGGQTMALPIGCPVPVLVDNPSEDAPDDAQVWPATGNPSLIATSTHDTTFEHGYRLLMRALTYVDGSSRAALFDPQTMQPRVTSPEFVRALKDLREGTTGILEPSSETTGFQEAMESLPGPGEPARVMWPLRSQAKIEGETPQGVRVLVLPGAIERYDTLGKEWKQSNDIKRVTMLGTDGRLVAITSNSRNAAGAFRLAAWLASPQNGRQLAVASEGTAAVRRSLGRLPDDWTGRNDRDLGRQFSAALVEAMALPDRFVFPRIMRAGEYLELLGGSVCHHCAEEPGGDQEMLEGVAQKWEALTDEIGREQQTKAYQRHLGLLGYLPETR